MTLEIPAYTISEFEKLAGLAKNRSYTLIQRGELEAVLDVCGQYRITYAEAAWFIRNKESK